MNASSHTHRFSAVRLRGLIDCPRCKYGTLDYIDEKKKMRCADCAWIFTVEELKSLKVLPP